MKMAKEAYLGNLSDEWGVIENETIALVKFMKEQIEKLVSY